MSIDSDTAAGTSAKLTAAVPPRISRRHSWTTTSSGHCLRTAATRARLTEIEDAIAAIRTQVAATDLQRQASKKPIDPHWFHRAKTALRHLQRERAELLDTFGHAAEAKEALKDCMIAVLRERHDEASWARHHGRGASPL